jgi:hypothetical protein
MAEILRQGLCEDEPADSPSAAASWLWDGYLGPGKVTLLTSQWKSGKTTLLSVLLSRMSAGGELAGRSVQAGRAAVVTEESRADWDPRRRKLDLSKHVRIFYRPFGSKTPTVIQWRGLIAAMLELRRREGLDLVVIDSLVTFLPGGDGNTAGAITDRLMALRDWTDAGMSVALLHHPSKGRSLPGQGARGSGALASFVDILVEMYWYGDPLDESDRRRRLRAYSRHEETPRHLVVELTADGTDYVAPDVPADEAWEESSNVLRRVLEDAHERLTMKQILEQWPEDFPKPDRATIYRALKRGVEQGFIRRSGTGRKDDPYRYWLPEREEALYPGPNATPEQMERYQAYCDREFLESIGVQVGKDGETVMPPTSEEPGEVQSASAENPPPARAVEESPASTAVQPVATEPAAPPVGLPGEKPIPEKETREPAAAAESASPNAPTQAPELPVQVAPAAPPVSPKPSRPVVAPPVARKKPPAPEPELTIEEQRARSRRYHA